MGLLLSGFFWSYTAFLFPAGWLAERFGAKRVLTVGVATWSLATILTGFAGGLISLFALRLLLGIGESAAHPCVSKLFASAVPPAQRGRANGFTAFAQSLGPAFGTWIGGLMIAISDWRMLFLVFGFCSLLWIIPWQRARLASNDSTGDSRSDFETPTLGQIFRTRAFWGTTLGHFGGNYGLYFISSWLPVYLVNVRGLSTQQMAATAGAIYLVNAFSSIGAGMLFDRLLKIGVNRTITSKAFLGLSNIWKIACMAALALAPAPWAIPCLFLNAFLGGFTTPFLYASSQTLAGPKAIGRWMGVQMTVANVAGMMAPLVTGVLIDRTGGFAAAFGVTGMFYALAAFAWVVIIQKVEPVRWEGAHAVKAIETAPTIV